MVGIDATGPEQVLPVGQHRDPADRVRAVSDRHLPNRWLPTAGAVTLLLSATLTFSFWTVTRANLVPAATQTVTKAGTSWEVLTGPNWTTCRYDGKTLPCRPVKE